MASEATRLGLPMAATCTIGVQIKNVNLPECSYPHVSIPFEQRQKRRRRRKETKKSQLYDASDVSPTFRGRIVISHVQYLSHLNPICEVNCGWRE
jgi:hypothetical protein